MDPQSTTTTTLSTSALKAAISRYYKELKGYEGQNIDYELGLLTVRSFSKRFERITARDTSFACRLTDAFRMSREYSHLIGIVRAKWGMSTVLAAHFTAKTR